MLSIKESAVPFVIDENESFQIVSEDPTKPGDDFDNWCVYQMVQLLNSLSTALKWRPEYPIPGPGWIDLYGENANILCFLELELQRQDPVNNVAKIWRWLEDNPHIYSQKRLIVLQAFSKHRSQRSPNRRNALFIGQKMARAVRNLSYEPLTLELMPPKKGSPASTDTREQLQKLCAKVIAYITPHL